MSNLECQILGGRTGRKEVKNQKYGGCVVVECHGVIRPGVIRTPGVGTTYRTSDYICGFDIICAHIFWFPAQL